jgi:hypothetical protein
MEDFTLNSRTVVTIDALRYNLPLSEHEFTLEALRGG